MKAQIIEYRHRFPPTIADEYPIARDSDLLIPDSGIIRLQGAHDRRAIHVQCFCVVPAGELDAASFPLDVPRADPKVLFDFARDDAVGVFPDDAAGVFPSVGAVERRWLGMGGGKEYGAGRAQADDKGRLSGDASPLPCVWCRF